MFVRNPSCLIWNKKAMLMFKPLSVSAIILAVAGCGAAGTQEAARPDFAVPTAFESTSLRGAAIESGWLATFNDPRLEKLVAEVLAKNFDLEAAAAQVDAAAAAAKQAGAALTPAIGFSGSNTNSGSLDTKDGENAASTGASLDLSWELDVWGRIRSGRDAATDQFEASKLDYEYARLSLAAQTAKAYFLAIERKRQFEFAQQTRKNFAKTQEIAQAFYDEGTVGRQDVLIAQSQSATADDVLESARGAYLSALRSLEALLGRYPSADVDVPNELPFVPQPIDAGVPSQVLERRPDVVAAERRVASAFNQLQSAQAAKMPRISLTSSVGGSASSLSDIVNPGNVLWNSVTNVMFPIFDGGALQSQVDAATAAQKQALATYQSTALQAFNEIEEALTNEKIFRRRALSLAAAYEFAKQAEEIGLGQYSSGQGNLLEVQQLQRATIQAQSALITVENDLLAQRVNLYLGLGGEI